MRHLRVLNYFIAIIFALSFTISSMAGTIVVPAGLEFDFSEEFDFPENVDITYQVIPAVDKSLKYMAIWNADALQYTIALDKLPKEYLDPKVYMQGFYRDIKTVYKDAKPGGSGGFNAKGKLKATAVELLYSPTPDNSKAMIGVHLTDGQEAYGAVVTEYQKNPDTDAILKQVVSIFRLANVADPENVPHADKREEDGYIGSWMSESKLPDGQPVIAKMNMDQYLNFKAEVSVKGKVVFIGTGAWYVSDKKVFWNYIYSDPQLADGDKTDEDEVISFEKNELILKNKKSGKTNTFKRLL
jgi:hypothetical protein